ncbi:DUF2147 domain-containing protein [Gilvimarinus agarilyticus]|nr:DUF2147 domain-containing protein [Gilvimarinus agarilyticus]
MPFKTASVPGTPSCTELTVRGYIGFSLFGRSQTWIRQPE